MRRPAAYDQSDAGGAATGNEWSHLAAVHVTSFHIVDLFSAQI